MDMNVKWGTLKCEWRVDKSVNTGRTETVTRPDTPDRVYSVIYTAVILVTGVSCDQMSCPQCAAAQNIFLQHNSCVLRLLHIVTVVWTINCLQSISPEQSGVLLLCLWHHHLCFSTWEGESHTSHPGRTGCLVNERMMQRSHSRLSYSYYRIHLVHSYCEAQARVRQGLARDGSQGERPQSRELGRKHEYLRP